MGDERETTRFSVTSTPIRWHQRPLRERGGLVKPQPLAPVPRVALTREEAAAALGVGLTTFKTEDRPRVAGRP